MRSSASADSPNSNLFLGKLFSTSEVHGSRKEEKTLGAVP